MVRLPSETQYRISYTRSSEYLATIGSASSSSPSTTAFPYTNLCPTIPTPKNQPSPLYTNKTLKRLTNIPHHSQHGCDTKLPRTAPEEKVRRLEQVTEEPEENREVAQAGTGLASGVTYELRNGECGFDAECYVAQPTARDRIVFLSARIDV